MARARLLCLLSIVGLLILHAGCDRPPQPPKNAEGDRIEVLSVAPSDPAELQAASALEAARIGYRYRLQVLQGYYENVGNMDKLIWARREMKNLDQAQTFTWSGLPDITTPKGESVKRADEKLLVESLVASRTRYRSAVGELAEFYQRKEQPFKAALIANLLDRFDPIRTYMYFMSAEVPPVDLSPSAVLPEADRLYDEALALHEKGKGLLRIAVTTSYPKQRQALLKFRELVDHYPTSNKISLSAYYIGEIYKEYFNEHLRAVQWYRRAWQWDSNLPKPARYQAATVYDIRLREHAKAVECYRLVIKHEQFNTGNVRYAHQRIRELTGK